MVDETALARAALAAINQFEQLQPSSPRLAALRLYGVAVERCLDLGLAETDITEMVFRIARAREEAELG
jgi:hypothetical protein